MMWKRSASSPASAGWSPRQEGVMPDENTQIARHFSIVLFVEECEAFLS
jgi:hypothetical protein